ncbi:MAG: UDP-N-acetylmuramoyl-tripeptide--D-alanyl-D-alanine ligase [Deltaproteobacteria bacterium]
MTLADLVEATGGRVDGGDLSIPIEGLSTDSRLLTPGQAFVALAGPHHDGHDHLADAASRGASALVCQAGRGKREPGAVHLEVGDTLYALGEIARWHRSRFDCPLVAITGSNGKTTTKEMLRSVLALHHGPEAVLANEGNLNNLIGLPLSLMGLAERHRVAVLEMGTNAPGEITRLAEIASPTHALITSIGPAHLEGLGSIDGVAVAKGELFRGLSDAGTCLVNTDDERIAEQAALAARTRFDYGRGGRVWAGEVYAGRVGSLEFTLSTGDGAVRVVLGFGGRHNVTNAVAAAAAGLALGVDLETVVEGLASCRPPPMRAGAERLANGVTLINDCYNANPASLEAALDLLEEAAPGRRIVVLGDMLELGPETERLHENAGKQAARLGPSLVCAVGEQAAAVCRGARSAGLGPQEAVAASDRAEAAEAVAAVWRSGDTVLVKGSRAARMEEVVSLLCGKAQA